MNNNTVRFLLQFFLHELPRLKIFCLIIKEYPLFFFHFYPLEELLCRRVLVLQGFPVNPNAADATEKWTAAPSSRLHHPFNQSACCRSCFHPGRFQHHGTLSSSYCRSRFQLFQNFKVITLKTTQSCRARQRLMEKMSSN